MRFCGTAAAPSAAAQAAGPGAFASLPAVPVGGWAEAPAPPGGRAEAGVGLGNGLSRSFWGATDGQGREATTRLGPAASVTWDAPGPELGSLRALGWSRRLPSRRERAWTAPPLRRLSVPSSPGPAPRPQGASLSPLSGTNS